MVRFTRRASDTPAFLVVYWTFLILAAVALAFYAKDRIELVKQRKTVIQMSKIEATSTNPILDIPDIIVYHNSNMRLTYYTQRWYNAQTFQNEVNSPFKNLRGKRDNNADRLTPAELESISGFDSWGQGDHRYISASQNEVEFLVTSKESVILRKDYKGYFGSYDDSATQYTMTSDARTTDDTSIGKKFKIVPSLTKIKETEILLMTVQTAIGSFGGIMSLITSFIVFFFGAGRVNPFGFVQNRILGYGTRERIRRIYGTWKKDEESLDHIQDKHEGSPQPPLDQELAAHRRQLNIQDRKIKELETLLKTFYLDMNLVDTKDDVPARGSAVTV
ncbi:hypothetical protein BGX31_006212 [Mortierella sp. GBA43]|nr:hypothetical protein BGX31_006212 [Mortierella sp. GBA43]